MNILLYADDLLEYGMRLREKIEEVTGARKLVFCQEISRLQELLLRKGEKVRIGILCIRDENDMDRLVAMQNLFDGLFIILILPCIDDGIIAKGHKLKPRFFSYADSEFDEVATVLKHLRRMAGKNKFLQVTWPDNGDLPEQSFGNSAIISKTITGEVNKMAKLSEIKDDKYLTFRMSDGDYGIGILKIKEIIGMTPITDVPQTPQWVKGVINLRGKVIPVIDLRLRFALEAKDYTERTCIIIVEIVSLSGKPVIGIVVDSVSEVLHIKGNDIEETPSFGARLNTDYILGMAKISGGIKTLLDIDRVLCSEEISMLSQVA